MSQMKVTDEVFDLGLLVETLDCYARARKVGWWDYYVGVHDIKFMIDQRQATTEFIKEICSLMGFKKPKTKQVLLALEAQE